jgi:HlyD family secretion protein
MKRGTIGIALLAVAVAAGLAYGFLPRPAKVETVAARTGPLAVTVEEEARTRVLERYTVSAPVSGYARRIVLKAGDAVAAGQPLAEIEPVRSAALDPRSRAQAEAALEAAAAALAGSRRRAEAAAAEARLARQELARSESLGQARFLSQAAVDAARARNDQADAARLAAERAVDVAGHELAAARALLSRAGAPSGTGTVAVTAPVAGRVLKVEHESAGAVVPGQPLVEIGDAGTLEVMAEVLSTAAVRIVPGTRVVLDRWGGGPALEGRVRVVEPAGFTKISALGVEEQRVRVVVDITTPREVWQRLGDGYRVEASFVVWEAADVLQVPTSALFRHGDGWAAYVVEDGRARLRPLTLGQRTGLQAQVLAGLKAGERLISHPDDRIRDGARVSASEAPAR